MDKTAEFWDKQAKKYDKSESSFEIAFFKIIKKTKKYLKPSDIVLDYGCATGSKSFEFASNVKKLYGIDISPNMIIEAKRKAEEKNIKNVEFSSGTIFDENLRKESFDVIISYGVLHLLEMNKEVLQRVNELLKSGGLFISTTACLKEKMTLRSNFKLSLYLLMKRIGLFPIYLNMLRASDVDDLISIANFQILETEIFFHGITIYFVVAKKEIEKTKY